MFNYTVMNVQNFWVYMWIYILLLIIMYHNYVEKLPDK